MVIAAPVGIDHRRTPKLGCEDDESIFKRTTAFKVGKKGSVAAQSANVKTYFFIDKNSVS
jgi:hypothetical protein